MTHPTRGGAPTPDHTPGPVVASPSEGCACDPSKNEVCAYHAYGERPESAPEASDDGWVCYCDEWNRSDELTCSKCGRSEVGRAAPGASDDVWTKTIGEIEEAHAFLDALGAPEGPLSDRIRQQVEGLAPRLSHAQALAAVSRLRSFLDSLGFLEGAVAEARDALVIDTFPYEQEFQAAAHDDSTAAKLDDSEAWLIDHEESIRILVDALEKVASEPAPGQTLSCRNIARKALQDYAERPAQAADEPTDAGCPHHGDDMTDWCKWDEARDVRNCKTEGCGYTEFRPTQFADETSANVPSATDNFMAKVIEAADREYTRRQQMGKMPVTRSEYIAEAVEMHTAHDDVVTPVRCGDDCRKEQHDMFDAGKSAGYREAVREYEEALEQIMNRGANE